MASPLSLSSFSIPLPFILQEAKESIDEEDPRPTSSNGAYIINDIIFGSTNKTLCKDFSCCMQKEFEMSMMGELNFFLGIQVKQLKHGTFLNQTKYCIELIKEFGIEKCKKTSTPIATSTYLDLDEKGKTVGESRYRGMIRSLLYLIACISDIML